MNTLLPLDDGLPTLHLHSINEEQSFGSHAPTEPARKKRSNASRLYKIIIDIAFAWKALYSEPDKAKQEKILKTIGLLELERAKIFTQMIT